MDVCMAFATGHSSLRGVASLRDMGVFTCGLPGRWIRATIGMGG